MAHKINFLFLSVIIPVLLFSACATVSPLVRDGHRAELITIDKSDRLLTLWEKGQPLKTYKILSMGWDPVGPKVQEGDGKTPEGRYFIDEKHPSQRFQKFLQISYPNDRDRQNAAAIHAPVGGHVGIHGDKGGWSGFIDRMNPAWTSGCISLSNDSINEIYALVPLGTEILIQP